jgi:hypothetical protein
MVDDRLGDSQNGISPLLNSIDQPLGSMDLSLDVLQFLGGGCRIL